jgi:hypothetical protein
MPILEPGSDGELAAGFEDSGFKDWRWGAVYTVRPDLLQPLVPGCRYRSVILVRRKLAESSDYAALYQRARALAAQRAGELGPRVYQWIERRRWGRLEVGSLSFGFAALTLGWMHSRPGDAVPMTLPDPSPEELAQAGEMRAEAPHPVDFHEMYNDFDFRPSPLPGLAMYSYAEYVNASGEPDFEPILARAERNARLHHASLDSAVGFRVLRREWMFISDTKLAVIHVYFRA